MKITISGKPGSGKSTVAKIAAKKLNLKHHSTGDFMRQMVKDRGITLLELSKEAEINPETDKAIDKMSEEFGKNNDDFIIDSRLAFHFIPDSIKLFLDVSIKEAAKRIFNDLRSEEKENISLEQTEKNILRREQSEKERYQKYYGLDPCNHDHYDLVINTTNISAQEVADKIIEFIQKKIQA